MPPKIHLTGYIDIPADRIKPVTSALSEHIRLTREETGCLHFDVSPCPQTPLRYVVDELYVDQQAFEFHQSRLAKTVWARITKGIPRQYKIRNIQTI